MTTYRQNNEMFGTTMSRVLQLPDFITEKTACIKGALAEWQELSPLVEDVVSGRTSFEQEVVPLVTANQKLTCNTPEYENLATKVATRLDDFFRFSWDTFIVPVGPGALCIPVTISLLTPIKVARRHQWLRRCYPAIYLWFEPKRLLLRREFAERLLEEAKRLDALVARATSF